jgi:hypothetical protein
MNYELCTLKVTIYIYIYIYISMRPCGNAWGYMHNNFVGTPVGSDIENSIFHANDHLYVMDSVVQGVVVNLQFDMDESCWSLICIEPLSDM